jgi:hypothetical protein
MKALFDIRELSGASQETTTPSGTAFKTSGDVLSIIGHSVAQLRKVLGKVEEGQIIKYWTNRSWSVYDMLYCLSEYTGPAELYMTAWTCTEKPAQILYELKQSGRITKVHCLMDYRITNRKEQVLSFFQSLLDRKAFTKVHAKSFALIGKERSVSIVGSANFTENIRGESGTLFCQTAAARWDAAQILHQIRKNV